MIFAAVAASLLCGCATEQVSTYYATEGQEAIVRDGVPAIVSSKPGSIVLVRQAKGPSPEIDRVVYVVGILNLTDKPVTFNFSNLTVAQTRQGVPVKSLRTYSYEVLVREEKNRQIGMAVLAGLAGAANAAAAANAGYYSGSGMVTGPYGTSHVSYSGYSPALASTAQLNASIQNQQMFSSMIETGRRNLDALEQGIIKDNTMFPGEWYGGQVHFDAAKGEPPQAYQMTIQIGNDRHVIGFSQSRTKA
jgi:hypothetical protein